MSTTEPAQDGREAPSESAIHIEVYDHGANTTLFVFAGLAVRYLGMPSFEFRRILQSGGFDANLVFIRDVHRSFYHLRPDGSAGGIDFFKEEVCSLKERLGAERNLTLGVSIGGSAAFYFAVECGMQKIIAFSPGFPLSVYTAPLNQLHTYLNLPLLIRSPRSYVELFLVTSATAMRERQLRRAHPEMQLWDVLGRYRVANPRPPATLLYGQHCPADARQARILDFPEVKRVALPTAAHNCAGVLKREGTLASTLVSEIWSD